MGRGRPLDREAILAQDLGEAVGGGPRLARSARHIDEPQGRSHQPVALDSLADSFADGG